VPYFFIPPGQIQGDYAYLSGEDARHAVKVLRVKAGEKLILQDEQDNRYICRVLAAKKDLVQLKIIEKKFIKTVPQVAVTLVQGVAKGDKMDFIIQKATELGAARVIPVETERTVVIFDERKKRERLERWQKIAYEAAKQAGISRVPEIMPVINLKTLQPYVERMPVLVPYEEEEKTAFKKVLQEKSDKVAVVIGPEGGFEKAEIDFLKSLGATAVSLGPRILRTETAAITALALVLYQWGDLGGELA